MPERFGNVKQVPGAAGGVEPQYRDSGVAIAGIVRETHEHSIDTGLARLRLDGLAGDVLEDVLTYCAEQRCVADGAVCPGCRLDTERKGLADLDGFIEQFAEIRLRESGGRILAGGTGVMEAESLESLSSGWAGETYWYWARRVLRKLRHGVRRANIRGAAFAGEGETPVIILMEPQLADNIGMVARAMGNFGLDVLRVVNPRDGWPNEKARVAASGANYVIDDAVAIGSLEEGIGDLNWVCATTARQRDLAKPVLTPEQAVAELFARIGRGERCGMLFGRERNGLETDEVALADALVMIPVNPRFASLNLAQAVLLMGYEWLKVTRKGTLGRVTTYETAIEAGLRMRGSEFAERAELVGFFEHLESELDKAGFFNPPHKRQSVVRNLRTMFLRMGATKQEVQTLRGIVATLGRARGTDAKLP